MYEKDGETYFVVDGHVHYWDASPENWVEGQEKYAKGWIESFYAYHQLGPEEYYWPMEKYQKYSEETMMKDLFEDGYVDKAIFLPTNLREWYKDGFNTTEKNATLAEKYTRTPSSPGERSGSGSEQGRQNRRTTPAPRYRL